jgi:hypothetical protein
MKEWGRFGPLIPEEARLNINLGSLWVSPVQLKRISKAWELTTMQVRRADSIGVVKG